MTTRRAPLANVPNATNSPHHAVSTTAAMKRGRPPGPPWDCAPPPLKKQMLDADTVDTRPPQKSLSQQQTGESKLFTRRTNTQPTAFEKKLVAARDKPKQPNTLKVSRNIKYCPESVESVRQWQRHYRKVFPTYVFYFESIPVETRKKYVRQIMSLGATEEKFFSRIVTHVVTSRSIPPEHDSPKPTEMTQTSTSAGNNLTEGSVQTVNPSLLEKSIDTAQSQLVKTRSRTGFGMIEPENKKGPGDLLYRARQMNMKIWTLDKLQRVIFTMNDKELAHILQPSRNGGAAVKTKAEEDLSLALQHEKLHAPVDSDTLTLSKGLVPFKGPYLYVWDFARETRPIVVREYPKVARKQDGAWPQFRGAELGKCPFIDVPANKRTDKEKLKKQPTKADPQAAVISKAMAPPARGPSKLNQQSTNQDDTESAVEEPAGKPFEPVETTAVAPRPLSKGSISASSLAFKFGGEPAASGVQPSNITSAIRSQMISSTAAVQGAKAGTSKEVHELKRKVLEKSSGIVSTAISSSYRADAAAASQQQPARMPIARAAKLKAQLNEDGKLNHTEHSRRTSDVGPRKNSGLRKQQSGKKRESKPGYCENCREKFEDFEDHVETRKHRKFAMNPNNFYEIDAFIEQLTSYL
ncbi:DBF zinc finger domain-containing protein [Arthroderma uncinatum]|uniref:DBF zinc finger domain-containing protein n=1 Tax=Arthroderma uncinatum TaxID=74035 RepID=UPI00144ACB59|nr:DBF zinc finger domain-containing protein [Arthroderma uncinatum]KAF3492346.1 DBF zinc finger domain-containing protein [Arthroderma uncinatum]